jgi:cytochrome c oxidase cbb3-type subunit 3
MTKSGAARSALSAPATVTLCVAFALVACEREERRYHDIPQQSAVTSSVRLTTLQPGMPQPPVDIENPYQGNAWALGEGKRLFSFYNCNGCHANGGGGIGPALSDDEWIYGFRPAQIFATIVQGRPNGMPAYAGRIPDQQVWQLVAYVHSLSGLVPKDSAPGRNDDAAVTKPELRKEREQPKQTGHK